jgi:hypothetical protein
MDVRREPRYPIEVGAEVEVKNNGGIARATTVNGSGCGVLLKFDEVADLAAGEKVMCDFNIMDDSKASLPCWAVGNVVRVDGRLVAINFKAGGFYSLKSATHRKPSLKMLTDSAEDQDLSSGPEL